MSQVNKPLGPEYRQYFNMVRRAIIERMLEAVFSEYMLAVWAIQHMNTWGYQAKTFVPQAIALGHIRKHSEGLGREQYAVVLSSLDSLPPRLLDLCLDHGRIERVCVTLRNPDEPKRAYTQHELALAIADTARMDRADLKHEDASLVIGELIAFDFLRLNGDGLYEITVRGYKANGLTPPVSAVAKPAAVSPADAERAVAPLPAVVSTQFVVSEVSDGGSEAVFPWKDGDLVGMSEYHMERLRNLFRVTNGAPFSMKTLNPNQVGYSSKAVLRLFLANARKARVVRFVSKGDKDLHEWVLGD